MSYPNIPPASTLPEKATATVEFGIVACALRYWTQALDFQGRATRRDILVAMVMNLLAFTILETQLKRLASAHHVHFQTHHLGETTVEAKT